jgi:3',5'-cyclic AMP phosphodiesterase CpdA
MIPGRKYFLFRLAAAFCILAILICMVLTGWAQPDNQMKPDALTLCFLSDTQEPLLVERIYLDYNDNAKARELIFEKILELNPKSVIHPGDLVSMGSKRDSWKEIDRFVEKLRKKDIEFSPIPGNHEYLASSKKGIAQFAARYPSANLAGYSRRYGSIAVVLFNSNFDDISKDKQLEQLHWYRKTLEDYDRDSSVDFVIVGCHHPPFTNSRIVSASKEVRDLYLPEYYKSKKCKLFISGHAHAYEHFQMNGKDFLVIGGGGGIQHPLNVGKKAKYQDIFSNSEKKRMFHFLAIKSLGDTLSVELWMLRPDRKGFQRLPQLSYIRNSAPSHASTCVSTAAAHAMV